VVPAYVPEGWDELTSALNARGVRHVAPTRAVGSSIDDVGLFVSLWSSSDARLRESAVALLLVRPELADAAVRAIALLPEPRRERAMMAYVAASALQRMWRTRLGLALGAQPTIPARFLGRWSLPPLEEHHGELTLVAVAELEEATHGYAALTGYHALMDGLLGELDAALHRA
jgi:hypothetical protein